MNIDNPKIWSLTDGSQGMISQTKGLANELSVNIKEIKTEIIFPWNKLQPGILPIFNWIFKNKLPINEIPDLVISCGRKSVYLSIYLKKKYILLPLDDQSIKKEAIGEENEFKVHRNFKKSFGKIIQKNSILKLMSNNKFWKKQGLFNDKLKKYYFGTRNINSVIDLKKKLLSILKNK